MREGNVATAAQRLPGRHLVGRVVEGLAGREQGERVLRTVAPLDAVGVSL